ncbi:MAG: DUF983 domain-containing protein [Planctomycetota bacterium]|nr:DUF983 domain-containing protein [Planctomycetota bacterium]
MRIRRALWRSLRLKCCLCGIGSLFHHWFKMRTNCPHCGTVYEREAGFFLGSIYFNYAFTALSMSVTYIIALVFQWASNQTLLWLALAYTIVMPVILFPFARSLWMGFDHLVDPRDREPEDR